MYNKFDRKMFKACKYKNVYIIKKIVKDFNKLVIFLTIRYNFTSLININITFLNMNNIVKFVFINLINVNTNLVNVNSSLINIVNKLTIVNKINFSQFLIKIYKLWYQRFIYLKSVKLQNFYKIITLKKLIWMIYNHNNICEIYVLIKFNNSKSHEISKRKIAIF